MAFMDIENLFMMVAVVYLSVGYFAAIYIIDIKRKKRGKRKEKFFKALSAGLKINTIETLDDVVNIYKGIAGLSSENLSYRYGLSSELREFLVEIVSKNKELIDISDENAIINWKKKITDYIQQNEKTSPFSDLPSAERNILSDISTFLDMNDSKSVKRKVLELAGMIQARNDDLNKFKSINNWTIPLSILGSILTIVFGIIALGK